MTLHCKDKRPFSSLACFVPLLLRGRASGREKARAGYCFAVTDTNISDAPFTSTSPGFTSLLGFESHEVLRISNLCLCGPNTHKATSRKIIAAHHKCQHCHVPILWYRKDGIPIWVYVYSCPIAPPDAVDARPCQHLNVLVDVTSTRPSKIGKYIMGRVIGSGASGVVRIGKSTVADDIVAVKIIDAGKFRSISEIEQIQDEISVLSNLKHPNIIRLLDVHFVDSVFYFIMDFASGGTLVKHVYTQPNKRLEEEEAKRIFCQMVSAVDYCHRRRVIHRDLKPENILLDEEGNVKVADFGLAAISAPFSGNLTTICGTPEFLAPEVISGREYDGPAVDIWSMGVILYEFMSGKVPFSGSSQSALFKEIQRGIYQPLPSRISEDCANLVNKMLKVDPMTRIPMEELLKHPWVRCPQFREDESSGAETATETGVAVLDKNMSGLFTKEIRKRSAVAAPTAEGSRGLTEDGEPGVAGEKRDEGIHESVKLVLGDWEGKEDPVSMAIMRSQMGRSASVIVRNPPQMLNIPDPESPTGCDPPLLTPSADDLHLSPTESLDKPLGKNEFGFHGRRRPTRKKALPPLFPERKGSPTPTPDKLLKELKEPRDQKPKIGVLVDSTGAPSCKTPKPGALPPLQDKMD
ncbi:hypothetical protein BSKO_11127 [Bryopsis sp. KO-2023]|nr:hypothetical protein BSKO_11127 [Bryopsis sp. KO-2023]